MGSGRNSEGKSKSWLEKLVVPILVALLSVLGVWLKIRSDREAADRAAVEQLASDFKRGDLAQIAQSLINYGEISIPHFADFLRDRDLFGEDRETAERSLVELGRQGHTSEVAQAMLSILDDGYASAHLSALRVLAGICYPPMKARLDRYDPARLVKDWPDVELDSSWKRDFEAALQKARELPACHAGSSGSQP